MLCSLPYCTMSPTIGLAEDMPAIAILSQEVAPKILGEGEATELATRATVVAVDERGRFI